MSLLNDHHNLTRRGTWPVKDPINILLDISIYPFRVVWLCISGSDCQSLIICIRNMLLKVLLISVFDISLIIISMAPHFQISSHSVSGYSLSVFTPWDTYLVVKPAKTCAAYISPHTVMSEKTFLGVKLAWESSASRKLNGKSQGRIRFSVLSLICVCSVEFKHVVPTSNCL